MAKNQDGFLSIFVLAFFCGIMMHLAIDNYNNSKNFLFVILPVVIFILCGFEHSIANMFYFNLSWDWNCKSICDILIMILGNGMGALSFSYFKEKKNELS